MIVALAQAEDNKATGQKGSKKLIFFEKRRLAASEL